MNEAQLKRTNLFGAIAFLILGIGAATWIVLSPDEPERTPRVETGELVTVVEARSTFAAPRVHAQGTVVPARRITVQPDVSGRIVERHSGLVDGGVVQKGETLLRIDPRDYEIALAEARTGVDVARAEFAMEEGRQVVARQEWERFGSDDEEPPPLALREPQLRQAELAIDRAQQRLQRAQLELERTRLRAPFTALVTQAGLEVGELVGPSTAVATVVALDEFWVKVSIPLEALELLALPGRDGDLGSRAFIRHESGSRLVEQRGRIIRLLGDLDPAGRMAQVLVSVQDPFSLSSDATQPPTPETPSLRQQPLMLGSYVSVEFEGATPREVILLPRIAVREGRFLYIADENDNLAIREVDFAWRNRDIVAVAPSQALQPGERVIISGLAAPVEGMPLRPEVSSEPPVIQNTPFSKPATSVPDLLKSPPEAATKPDSPPRSEAEPAPEDEPQAEKGTAPQTQPDPAEHPEPVQEPEAQSAEDDR